jgi:hypothetical protein
VSALKLPRKVEADPRHAAVAEALARDLRPLWEKGQIAVPHLSLTPGLEKALLAARDFRQLERGLENIEKILDNEKKGLDALQAKQGTEPALRLSRLLIIADDGAERFNRACESLVHHHADRLLCLRLDVPSSRLSEKLFGADSQSKGILVSDREAVSNTLLALVAPAAAQKG